MTPGSEHDLCFLWGSCYPDPEHVVSSIRRLLCLYINVNNIIREFIHTYKSQGRNGGLRDGIKVYGRPTEMVLRPWKSVCVGQEEWSYTHTHVRVCEYTQILFLC